MGERSALGLERNAILLIDDRRARRVAVESGRAVIGTLGLLVRTRGGFYNDASSPCRKPEDNGLFHAA